MDNTIHCRGMNRAAVAVPSTGLSLVSLSDEKPKKLQTLLAVVVVTGP